ncbi:MAG: RhuM family protein [Saprospiraceae bacterium]
MFGNSEQSGKKAKGWFQRNRALYSDVIISLGYQVNTQRGIQFRQWATQRLKDYLVQGYSELTKGDLPKSSNRLNT